MTTIWDQIEVRLPSKPRGCHWITDICNDLPQVQKIKYGIAHFFLRHTSASITLNETWDPDVAVDFEDILNKVVKESKHDYRHSSEGIDDMPAHGKTSFVGVSISVPITNGRLNLGTWQGLWLCEHRNHGGSRTMVVTVNGQMKE